MKNNKNLLKLILGFIIFFFTSYVAVLFFKYGLNLNIVEFGNKELALADGFISCVVTILFIIIYFDIIKSGFKSLVLEPKKSVTQVLLAIVIGYLVLNAMQIFANYITTFLFFITGIDVGVAENQQTIEELLNSAPLIMIISSCILAPIEEELLFRGAIRKTIKNKKVFIACSGLIFGLMHVTDSLIFIGELLLLGVVIDKVLAHDKLNYDKRKMLSVALIVLILLVFAIIYYFVYGNLINVIMGLNIKEVIGSVTYVIMGITLASLYIYNDENILTNIGIHAANNFLAVMLALFLR